MTNPRPERCPWCMSESVVRGPDAGAGGFYVECRACSATGPVMDGRDKAVHVWNHASRAVRARCGRPDGTERAKSPIRREPTEAAAGAGCGPRAADKSVCPPKTPDSGGQVAETVDDPAWYTRGPVETIDKVEAVVDGLPAREAFLLGQVVRYVDRAGMKDEAATDLGKANNYAHRLVGGKWRKHD